MTFMYILQCQTGEEGRVEGWTNQNSQQENGGFYSYGSFAHKQARVQCHWVSGKAVDTLWRYVTFVANFQPDEENYTLCFKFCKSNFCYHRFLDVNSTNVTRAIEE